MRRAIRPWVVDEETLATEVIDRIGPGGNFLSESHTAEHFCDEILLSPLSPVRPWADAHKKPEEFDPRKFLGPAREALREMYAPMMS